MKLVLFSDLHLDSAFSWMSATPNAARKRRQALRDTLLKIIELTQEVKADALLCGGDLYEHDRFTPDTGQFLRTAFASLGQTRVFIAPGNHDWYGPQSLYRTVDWPSNVHIFTEFQLTPVTLADGLTLWGAAHRGPANTPGFLEHFQVDRSGINLALFHGSERAWFTEQETGKHPHAPFDEEQIERSGLEHAFLGHFHRPRDRRLYTYPGNPDPLSFGEDGLRGAVVATVNPDGNIHREWVPVAVSEVHDIGVDITGCASQQDIRDEISRNIEGLKGYARVCLSGELSPSIDFRLGDLSSVESELDSLSVQVDDLYTGYNLELISKEETVRGEFVREVSAQDLPEDEMRRILTTGLRALDGRDDLEVV